MKRVLLVDDDPVVIRIYREGLSRQGFEVTTAGDGLSALKALHANRPDILVLDLMMPKLSGAEVLKIMRSQRDTETLPVIVLSNAYMDPLARDAANLGAQQGLLKVKCNPASLAAAINQILEGGPGAETVDDLLAAAKPVPAAPKPPPVTTPPVSEPKPAAAIPARTPEVVLSSAEAREQARQELVKNTQGISRSLRQLFDSFRAAENDHERELRFQDVYRKVHFLAAMAGMAEHPALAQMASAFEVLLFGIIEKNYQLEPSVELTSSKAVDFLHELSTALSGLRPGPQANSTALVVDDDRLTNRLVVAALRNVHLQAQGTENPETALTMLREKHYDLVLLDVEMPGMDGMEVCRRLRALPGYQKTPVIYVTLHSDFQTRAKTLLSGGTDLIAKPVLPAELAVKVVMHLLKAQSPPAQS